MTEAISGRVAPQCATGIIGMQSVGSGFSWIQTLSLFNVECPLGRPWFCGFDQRFVNVRGNQYFGQPDKNVILALMLVDGVPDARA